MRGFCSDGMDRREMERFTVCKGSVAMGWIGEMERFLVCKGSVAMIWIRKHNVYTIQKRF